MLSYHHWHFSPFASLIIHSSHAQGIGKENTKKNLSQAHAHVLPLLNKVMVSYTETCFTFYFCTCYLLQLNTPDQIRQMSNDFLLRAHAYMLIIVPLNLIKETAFLNECLFYLQCYLYYRLHVPYALICQIYIPMEKLACVHVHVI